ncbi:MULTISPECIES: hypothetical protein [Sorangium]|uniref:Terminase n=1 Tax=Sorangium cellulosum TaxID=56 RepID=A0A4P2QT34_SORCE|nr:MULTISPECIES: hypothetical protein [Sorangium]AUX33171.1 uncharacterized protein SOCE836_053250 [Sorangium cellulosum]AUX33228.1 uncharacterized protein SOCE836_053820 [Sorangium cellulosum]WCQ92547.1 hypothetical protein NQZ70_05288 [Sorangium sp. Soce836]
MTTARKGRKGEPLAARLLREVEAAKGEHRWPSTRWRDDPVGFFREVLMVEYLTEDQIAILQALTRPRARVSVASGHKTGKDFLAGGIAWWWACSDPEARVRATAVTAPQVRDVFWRELRAHFDRSHQHRDPVTGFMRPSPYPIDGVVPSLPHTGWRVGLREIVGFTADQGEAAAGISGRRVLYIYDEASGIDDMIFEASKGNLAGGDARALMLSQPTRNEGHFYDSHHEKRELWACFNLDSEKSPNVVAGREIVPGLATREWLDEQRIDWNAPDGPIWKIRVKGQFAEGDGQKVMTLPLVEAAERRWRDMPDPRDRLVLGLDCAGTGDDENAVAVRRGKKILELEAWHTPALPTPEERAKAVAARVMGIVRRHRREREGRALVVMDAGGTVGSEVYRELLRYDAEIDVRPVQFGAKSAYPREYQLLRDQLWFTFAERWLQDGGALPPDRKLPAELTAPGWVYDVRDQRRHVERKDALRRRLGRSTDRADACLLSVYEPPSVRHDRQSESEDGAVEQVDPVYGAVDPRVGGFDPYAGAMRRGAL